MAAETVAIAYSADADPSSSTASSPPAHVLHPEIGLIRDILLGSGREVHEVPVGDDVLERARDLAFGPAKVVINLCEDLLDDSANEMHFASILELLGIPYTGSGPLALGLCRDKAKSKLLLRQFGIPTPPFTVAAGGTVDLGDLRYPLIVKPACEDGSLGIGARSIAGGEEEVRRLAGELSEKYGPVLIEEYVDGRELNVALLGTAPVRVLPFSEIDFGSLPQGAPRICDYDAKWDESSPRYAGTVPICPADLEPEERSRIETFSKTAFSALGLRDYGRIDWRLSPSRGPQFLEANPNPDLSPSSGFLRSLRAAGLDYPPLVKTLLECALSRRSPAGAGVRS